VALTPTGLTFAMHARLVVRQIQHLHGDMQEYTKGVKGHLRIFANTTSLVEFLPPILQSYLAAHPDVNIDLHERPSREIVRAVTDGQTDIGIIAGNVATGELEVIPYRNDQLVLVTPRDHVLAKETAVAFADTLDYNHVGLHEASALHIFLREASDALHRPLPVPDSGRQFRSRLLHDCRQCRYRHLAGIGSAALCPEQSAGNRGAQRQMGRTGDAGVRAQFR